MTIHHKGMVTIDTLIYHVVGNRVYWQAHVLNAVSLKNGFIIVLGLKYKKAFDIIANLLNTINKRLFFQTITDLEPVVIKVFC